MASDYVNKLRTNEGQVGVAKEIDAMLNALSSRDPRTNASLLEEGAALPGGTLWRSGGPDGGPGMPPREEERSAASRIGDAIARMLGARPITPPPITTPAPDGAAGPPPAAPAAPEARGSTPATSPQPGGVYDPSAAMDVEFGRRRVEPVATEAPTERGILPAVQRIVDQTRPLPDPAVGEVRIAPPGTPLTSPPIDPVREQTEALASSIRQALTGAFRPTPPRDVAPIDVSKDMALIPRGTAGRPREDVRAGDSGIQIPIIEDDRAVRTAPDVVDQSMAPQAMVGDVFPGRIRSAVVDMLRAEGEKRMLPELVSYARERAAAPTSSLVEEAYRRRGR